LHLEIDMTHHQELQAPSKSLRAVMSVAAALCVLGLASLVFIHAPDAALATGDTTSVAADTSRVIPPALPGGAWTNNVPQADRVFDGKAYIAPEEPIAQF
jgi:hypothetical protein